MPTAEADSPYILGHASVEHARLIRQAALVDPFTERLFRDAGIGPGQRVLDVGSGVGDVAMLAGKLVGPSGEVVGVERDRTAIATARARVAEAGFSNVSFLESDARDVARDDSFDAVVGRAILSYVPDAAAVLTSLVALVRSGGVVAFQDIWPASMLHSTAHLPLRARCVSLIDRILRRAGVHMDMDLVFYRAFQDAGLPAPNMRIEVPAGDGPNVVRWLYDLCCTLFPLVSAEDLAASGIGELDSLESRLEAERVAARSFATCVGLVGAWSRKPE
jgi:ubiquinone/menaquinone biosynthesis C-methylase UbiE